MGRRWGGQRSGTLAQELWATVRAWMASAAAHLVDRFEESVLCFKGATSAQITVHRMPAQSKGKSTGCRHAVLGGCKCFQLVEDVKGERQHTLRARRDWKREAQSTNPGMT